MVRAGRYVRSHCADRISKRSSILDLQTLDRIGIVTAPDLRGVIHHTGIISSAASAAALDQHIRISLSESVQKFIQTKHITMRNFSLTFCRKYCTVNITDASVKIPFQIINICLVQNLCHLIKDMISDIFSGKIKHKLVTSTVRSSARHGKRPVRMCTVKVTVL